MGRGVPPPLDNPSTLCYINTVMTTTTETTSTGTLIFPSWDQLTRRQQLLSMISDDYKSLNGFRPRFNVDHMSDDGLEQWHNEIVADIAVEMAREARDEAEHNYRVSESMSRKPWMLGELVSLGG